MMENGKSRWTQDLMGGRERDMQRNQRWEVVNPTGPGVRWLGAQLCDWQQMAPVCISFLFFSPRKWPVTVPTLERCCKDETK